MPAGRQVLSLAVQIARRLELSLTIFRVPGGDQRLSLEVGQVGRIDRIAWAGLQRPQIGDDALVCLPDRAVAVECRRCRIDILRLDPSAGGRNDLPRPQIREHAIDAIGTGTAGYRIDGTCPCNRRDGTEQHDRLARQAFRCKGQQLKLREMLRRKRLQLLLHQLGRGDLIASGYIDPRIDHDRIFARRRRWRQLGLGHQHRRKYGHALLQRHQRSGRTSCALLWSGRRVASGKRDGK